MRTKFPNAASAVAFQAMLKSKGIELAMKEATEKQVRSLGSITCRGVNKKNSMATVCFKTISANKEQCLECFQKETYLVQQYNVMDQKERTKR